MPGTSVLAVKPFVCTPFVAIGVVVVVDVSRKEKKGAEGQQAAATAVSEREHADMRNPTS